jgi:hypothetical protein
MTDKIIAFPDDEISATRRRVRGWANQRDIEDVVARERQVRS